MKKLPLYTPTIRDIAREAGVSTTAVSFYLNNKIEQFKLSKVTCERIHQVIKKYNYQPNIHARAINERRTHLVGLVISNLETSFFARFVRAVDRELMRYDCHMVFSESDNNLNTEQEAIRHMTQIGVDGFIIAPTYTNAMVPVVYSDDVFGGKPVQYVLYSAPTIPVISTDHALGCQMVFERLWQSGHRRIAYLGPVVTTRGQNFWGERYDLFNAFFMEHGLSVQPFSQPERLLSEIQHFTAVFCYSDLEACRLLFLLQRHQIRVPEEVSIVGYGRLEEIASFVRPTIATVQEGKESLGALAVQQLLKKISDPKFELPLKSYIAPEFIPGETIGPARQSAGAALSGLANEDFRAVVSALHAAGGSMKHSDLLRKLRKSGTALHEIIAQLLQQGIITTEVVPGKTKSRKLYHLVTDSPAPF